MNIFRLFHCLELSSQSSSSLREVLVVIPNVCYSNNSMEKFTKLIKFVCTETAGSTILKKRACAWWYSVLKMFHARHMHSFCKSSWWLRFQLIISRGRQKYLFPRNSEWPSIILDSIWRNGTSTLLLLILHLRRNLKIRWISEMETRRMERTFFALFFHFSSFEPSFSLLVCLLLWDSRWDVDRYQGFESRIDFKWVNEDNKKKLLIPQAIMTCLLKFFQTKSSMRC